MKKVIKELWHGNICPQQNGVCNTQELQEIHHRMSVLESEFEETLSNEQKELFYKFMDCRNDYQTASEAEVFEYGFKLGTSIIVESLCTGELIEKE